MSKIIRIITIGFFIYIIVLALYFIYQLKYCRISDNIVQSINQVSHEEHKSTIESTTISVSDMRRDYEQRLLQIKQTYTEQMTEVTSDLPTQPKQNNKPIKPNKGSQVIEEGIKYIGIPYSWGGTTTDGMDCSGFTQYVYRQLGVKLPRVSAEQSTYGILVSRHELRAGDLLFFDTRNSRSSSDIKTPSQEMVYAQEVENNFKPNLTTHVGIYVGNGVMLHASSGDGIITYADLNTPYYKNRFLNARRIFN